MKFWISRQGAVSIREQLANQIKLAMVCGDLKAGEKLASVREMALHYGVHANTVSGVYRQLAAEGWLEARRGSGVYALDRHARDQAEDPADALIERWMEQARAAGIDLVEAARRFGQRAGRGERLQLPLRVADAEPELAGVLAAELSVVPGVGIVLTCGNSDGNPGTLAFLNGRLPPGFTESPTRMLPLTLRSPAEVIRRYSGFLGSELPARGTLVAVVSHSRSFLTYGRSLFAALGVADEALEMREAGLQEDYRRGLDQMKLVVADVVTADRLQGRCRLFVFPMIADSSLAEVARLAAYGRM